MAKPKIVVCIGSSCFSRGNERNVEVIQKYLEEHHLKDEVDVELEGSLCQGRCADGPIVVVGGQRLISQPGLPLISFELELVWEQRPKATAS